MLRSLRSKLIAAFAFIIFLSLFLAGTAFVFLLREYQARLALDQLADLALPLSFQVGVLERAGADPDQIGRFLEEQTSEVKVRMLLINPEGLILADTGGKLDGQQIHLEQGRRLARSWATYWGTYRGPDGQELYFVAPGPRPPRPTADRFISRAPAYSVALAVPADSISASWWRLVPSLSLAGAISLLISILGALFLAQSIAGPIAQITRASEQMAQGNYDQHIEVHGQDEVAKLADSFNRMAQQVALSHRTLRDFLANVSHELRTPLTSIQGFSQAMVDGAIHSPEGYAEAGQIITEEADRMRRLVDDLLDLSRLESGQIAMERRPLDLAELLRATVRRAERQARERGVTLELDVADLPPVEGDDHWVEQVFTNLLDNAIRHTPTGGLISIRARYDAADDEKAGDRSTLGQPAVSVRVHNTGSYIPTEDLPRVFERFYQVDRSRSSGGSGLGLAIVREIVQEHGGTVRVTSDPDDGTAFVVSLPAGLTAGKGRSDHSDRVAPEKL